MKVIKHKDKWYLQSETGYKEILLSTDTELQKDGVQAIDDEFLEWFVKNPSCEFVEIVDDKKLSSKSIYNAVEGDLVYSHHGYGGIINSLSKDVRVGIDNYIETAITSDTGWETLDINNYKIYNKCYKIIIPEQEPKQEISEEAKQRAKNYMSLKGALEPKDVVLGYKTSLDAQMLDSQYVDFSDPNADKITSASTTTIKEEPKQIKCYCGHTTYCDCGPLEETLEEAAESLFNNFQKENLIVPKKYILPFKLGFIKGAKWQAERMYSDEDIKQAFFSGCQSERQFKPRIKCWEEWFSQFKKK